MPGTGSDAIRLQPGPGPVAFVGRQVKAAKVQRAIVDVHDQPALVITFPVDDLLAVGDSRVVDLEPYLNSAAFPGPVTSVVQLDVIRRAGEAEHVAGMQFAAVGSSRWSRCKGGPSRLGNATQAQIIGVARGIRHDQPCFLATAPVSSEIRRWE